MKKKLSRILSTALALAILTGMTACSGGTPAGSSAGAQGAASGTGSASAGVTEVKYWHMCPGDEGAELQKIVDEFNASQSAVKVNAQYVPRDELMKQYTIGAVSGSLPDIGEVDNPDEASYVSMGVFDDITDLFNSWSDAKFLDGPMASCTYDGKIYGVPRGSNCLGLFYDVDMLSKAGVNPPANWSELTEACKKLTAGNVKGLAFSAVANEEGTFQFMPFLLSAGGNINDLSSSNSVKAMSYVSGLVKSGYVGKECINWAQSDVEKQFAAGSAAMMINGPWNISALKKDAPDKKWQVVKIPKADDGEYASILGGENLVICKGCTGDRRTASWEFIKYITGKDNSAKLASRIGQFSPRSDVDVQAIYKDDEILKVFAGLMPTAQSRGPHVKWPEVSSAIQGALQQSITDQATAQKAMTDAKKKVDQINATIKS